jgi:beta-lactam-binding protein with PASTA domain
MNSRRPVNSNVRRSCMLRKLKALLGPVVQIVRSLGIEVPDWRTRDDVANGRPDMVDVLSAKQAGLLVTFNVVQDLGSDKRVIIRIEPPVGTFVARGSEVVVTVNDG